jgi:uncharacterized protein YbjT (DUF2867 family)
MTRIVLVTGATGFIGGHVVADILENEPNTVVRAQVRRGRRSSGWSRRPS